MARRLPATLLVAALAVVGGACNDDDGGGNLAAFCEAAADTQRFEAVFDDLDPNNVEAARETFRTARDAQEGLRDLAPEAARADVDVVIAFVDDLIAGLQPGRDVDEHGRPSVYQALRPRFDEVEAAGDRLRVYVESNC
ncbi:hypothetical protein NHL50_17145 [Acidimicrobiia bacterium EGI L10123]|uniref:hypothetical protein n=1 Tax=Salinilacustrithrix flava TaxID=2957203 RepID=UPI003D7C145A|nr:hypothetical protein [Acidimicrobiia bacterium EGI L10123]